MLYTELTKKAMKISFEAHKNQTDKNGIPYIFHPIHLAEQMVGEKAICVALLHDVVEDTDMTFSQLEQEGFPEEIIDALKLMTHDKSVPYMDYVEKIKGNDIAAAVKLADLRHNSDLTRLDVVDEKAKRRYEKYQKAIKLLEKYFAEKEHLAFLTREVMPFVERYQGSQDSAERLARYVMAKLETENGPDIFKIGDWTFTDEKIGYKLVTYGYWDGEEELIEWSITAIAHTEMEADNEKLENLQPYPECLREAFVCSNPFGLSGLFAVEYCSY